MDSKRNNSSDGRLPAKRARVDRETTKTSNVLMDSDDSDNPDPEGPLVIPLIERNEWRIDEDHGSIEPRIQREQPRYGLQVFEKRKSEQQSDEINGISEENIMEVEMTVEEEAVQSLIKESDDASKPLDIPILAQNAVPGIDSLDSDTDKFRRDVSLRPTECTMEDYQRVPIEKFGAALLRGMGWREGQGVGKSRSGTTSVTLPKPRQHLLGLGAAPAPVVDKKPKKFIRPGEKRQHSTVAVAPKDQEEAPRTKEVEKSPKHFRVGSLVVIIEGSNKGKKGIVVDIKDKQSGTVVKVEIEKTKKIARVWIDDIESLEEKRPLSKKIPSWLRPHIKVRIISKSLLDGRYYNKKGLVQDVVRLGECTLCMEKSGDILESVKEKYLETVIPDVRKSVMVVVHEDPELVGTTAKLLEKHKDDEKAVIQYDHDFQIENVSYDQISEVIH